MRPFACEAMLVATFLTSSTFASAAAPQRISGEVHDRATGKPVAGARIALETPGGTTIATAISDRRGSFTLFAQPIAGERIVAYARDFALAAVSIENAADIALERAAPIAEIGRVASRSSSSSDAAPVRRVEAREIEREGALRVTDALGKLPGVTVTGDAGSPGGDAYVSLRGLRPGESRTLLDGHPVGPIGVAAESPDADGTIAGFNFQDVPYFALRDVDVSFGAAGSIDGGALGGTIDLLTIEPTKRDERSIELGYGNEGRAFTSLRATGTSGRFGYALEHGVVGTYGAFAGVSIAQSGLRGTDFTSATLDSLTYHVSGDYTLRNELAKVTYAASDATRISFTAYDATSWADKTGEGDNDFNSAQYVLANAPTGASPLCPNAVLVAENAGPQCVSPRAYAAAASGPAGGGPGAWQALRNQDYSARIATVASASTYALDAYAGRYAVLYHRDASQASGPLDAFLDRWSTAGARMTDDVASGKNALQLGVSALAQTLDGDGTSADGSTLEPMPAVTRFDAEFDVRDTYAITRRLSAGAGLRFAQTDALPRAHVDPQASLVYRPSERDTLRASASRATNEPALQPPRVDLSPVGALNPDCGAIARATNAMPANVSAGSGPGEALSAERGTDLELGFDHRFAPGSRIGATLYDQSISDRIVTGDLRAGAQLPASALPGLFARIDQFCGVMPAPGAIDLTLRRPFNVASARLRGFGIAGRARIAANLAIDYGYDVQSIVLDDLPASVLSTDSTLVNGAQAFGVPLHKASLGLTASLANGYEFRLDGRAVGQNNPQQLTGYAYADASLERTFSERLAFLLAVSNVFGSHVQTYGLVGEAIPYATNAYNAALSSPAAQPFNERYGLAPTTLTLSASAHL